MSEAPSTQLLNRCERPTGRHYLILGMSWAGWLFDFYDLMLFSFLLIPLKADLGLSDASLSLLLGTSLAATAVGGVIFGFLSDRFGRKRVLCWTILLYSIGSFLCGFAPGFAGLLAFRIVTGLGVGGEWASGQTLVSETFPARMRARFAAVMQTGAPAGVALAALVGGFVEPWLSGRFGPEWGWRGCFFLSIVPAALVALIRRWMPESDVWEAGRTSGTSRAANPLRGIFANPTLRRLFLVGLVLALTDMSAYWFTYTWLPKYLYQQLGFSMAKSGIWVVVAQMGALVGYLSFGVVADWKGRRVAYTVYSCLWAAGLLPVTLCWGFVDTWPWLAMAFMALVGIGSGNFSGYGPIFAELFPTEARNTAMGSAFNLARGAQFLTPLIITVVAERWGLGGGISLAAFFALFTGAWVWLLPETRGTVLGEE